MADSQITLIAARAAQGLGGAVIAPASLSILTTTFGEGPARNRAVGIWGAMGGIGGATGVILGGVITDALSWRWILFINVPIGVAAAVLALRYITADRPVERDRRFDLAGAVTATVGLSLLVLGIVRTSATGWGAISTLAFMGAGLALLLGFLTIEGRLATAPLMPLRIYRSRTLTSANLVVLLLGAASFGMWFFLSLYLQEVHGYSPIRAGLSFLPMTLSIVAGSVLASRAVSRIGAKPLLVAGMIVETAGLFMFTDLSPHGSYLAVVLVPSLLCAIGIGIAFVPATISAVAGVAGDEAGLASGLVNTARLFGGALGLAVLATLATSRTNAELHHAVGSHAALTSGFVVAFAVAGAIAALGALIGMFGLPGVRPRPAARERPRVIATEHA
jgi:EmrB/QacA subfamily drug resistance transporter